MFEFDTRFLASFSVLLVMGGVSLAFSLFFYLKSRAMKRLPSKLAPEVFDKTFNVFNPFPEQRRIFHSFAFFMLLSPLVVFSWTFLLVFVLLLKVLEAGLILGAVIFTLSLGLMMTGEAYEIGQNANPMGKAIMAGTSLALGDLAVLSLIKEDLRKFSIYYLLLAIGFFASFWVLPYAFPALLMGFSQLVGAMVGATVSVPILAPFLATLLFSLATSTVYIIARKTKTMIFGFPPEGALFSIASASVRGKITYERQSQILEDNPEQENY